MFKSGVLLVASGLLVNIMRLVSTAVIARVVSVEDYGIIATFALTIALAEMASAFALDRMIVQDRNGDDPRFVATLQTLQTVRGLLGAALVFLIAPYYARLLGVDDLVWPYQVLALVPLLTGLTNLHFYMPQRGGNFRSYMIWQLLRPAFGLCLLGVLLFFLDDWRIGLATTVAGQFVATIAANLMARGPFRLGFDRAVALRALRFGWPLMLNSLLLYAILNGDRILVSNQLGLETLALFSVALGLAQIPVSIVTKAHQYVFLPELSRQQDDPAAFGQTVTLTVQSRATLAIIMLLGIAVAGPDALLLVFGEKYAEATALVLWVGLFHAGRTLKGAPNTIAVSRAATTNPLYSNMLRLGSLPVAFLALQAGATLVQVIAIATVAELAALTLSLVLLRRTLGPLPRGVYTGTAAAVAVFALAALDAVLFPAAPVLFGSFHAFQIVLLAAGAAAIVSMGTMRRWARRKIGGLRGARPL